MLAERLLAKSDYDTDAELRTLEHLKTRFGESNLHSCEARARPDNVPVCSAMRLRGFQSLALIRPRCRPLENTDC